MDHEDILKAIGAALRLHSDDPRHSCRDCGKRLSLIPRHLQGSADGKTWEVVDFNYNGNELNGWLFIEEYSSTQGSIHRRRLCPGCREKRGL